MRPGMAEALRRVFIQITEGAVNTLDYDDWTINRWRLEPRLALKLDDSLDVEKAPPLWKDLALASVVALVLWAATAALFG